MAANTEIIGIDNVEKTLWDKIVNIATAFTANELTALSALAGIKTALAELAEDKTALAALAENISGETLTALMEIIEDGRSKTVIIPFDVESDTFTTEATVAQIHEADTETAVVFARFPMGSGHVKMQLIYSDEETVFFSGISYGNDGVSQNVLLGHTNDGVDAWQFITEPSA